MRFRDLAIRRKLTFILLIAVGFAIAVAAGAVVIYEHRTFRPRILERVDTQMRILSEIFIPPLHFDDPPTASRYLATLRHWPEISDAALFDSAGSLFAIYTRNGGIPFEFTDGRPGLGEVFEPRAFTLANRIMDEGRPLGFLWLRADLPPLPARLPQYGIMFGVVLLSLLAVSVMLGAGLKYGVSMPITFLVKAVSRVAERKDYRLRVPLKGKDEIGRLTAEFNRMLDAVERRDQSLTRANARNELILNTTIDGVTLQDPSGRYLDANPAACSLLGYTREEMRQLTLADIDADHDQQWIADLLEGIRVNGRSRFETRIRTKAGRVLSVEVSAALSSSEDVRILSALRDVTERNMAEEALSESRRLLQSIIDASSAVIYVKDLQGRYLLINRRYEELFHITKEGILGKTDFDLFPKEGAENYGVNDRKALAAGRAVEFEEVVPHDDGPHIYISIKAPLLDNSGRPYAVCGISADITDRKRVEEQLRQSQKLEAIGRLAGGVAHDFNNLLTAINGYSSLALQGMDPGHPLYDFLREIFKAGERAAGLTRQLLAYSRKQPMEARPWDINVIVADMEKMLKRLIGEDIDLITDLALDIGSVKVDRGQMEQVILNLAINARDAMPRGGRLTLETGRVLLDSSYVGTHLEASPGPHVMLAVSDTGTGMGPEVKARIFEPFFTTKEMGKGTGLGLSVVYGIVRQSGGSISVYSESGLGTTFRIYFPEIEKAPEGPGPAEDMHEDYQGEATLLLVEDDESVRKFARHTLESMGYSVLEAGNGLSALDILMTASKRIDLVITDVVMPDMGGVALAERIRLAASPPPILFISGYAEHAVAHNGLLGRGEHFLQKPFNPHDLGRMIHDILKPARTNGKPVEKE